MEQSYTSQRTLFDDDLMTWSPPDSFPEFDNELVAMDLECYDPLLKTHGSSWVSRSGRVEQDGFVTGIGVATKDREWYFPTRHNGGNLDEEAVWSWYREQAKKTNVEWAIFNRLYDEGWTTYRYDCPILGKIFDPMTAMPLLDENRYSYSLDSVSKDILKSKKNSGEMLQLSRLMGIDDPKARMHHLPSWVVGPYCEQDCRLTWDLVAPLKKKLSDEDLGPIFQLETDLVQVLLEMRYRGVRVDVDRAVQTGKLLEGKVKKIVKDIFDMTGHHIDIMNGDDISKMFDTLGIAYPRTPKTDRPSITKDLLDKIEHPVGAMIRAARKYSLAKGTFIDGTVLGHQINGKIHAQFHPLRKDDEDGTGGAVTGRFSSSNPTLQNLPALDPDVPLKDEVGLLIRGLFLPWEGEQWAVIDYSGQEPRLATHFAELSGIRSVTPFVQAYKDDPKMKFHKLGAKITGLAYHDAKQMTLGKMYGMGGGKLCHKLGLPTVWVEGRDGRMYEIAGEEGQKVIEAYGLAIPWVEELSDLAQQRGEHRGFVRTLLGRKLRFAPKFPRGAFAYKALNRLIQGSAADQMKKAMIALFRELKVVPLVTVHDENGLSVPDRTFAEKCADVMIHCVELVVPNAVDLEMGPTWGDAK